MKTIPRLDMSKWILHFIHDRNPNYEPSPEAFFGENVSSFFPICVNPKKNDRFIDFFFNEKDYYALEPQATAFDVLQRILDHGMLKSGWSFRNSKATIYGPRSAICFTEMPLSSLVTYAQGRADEGAVGKYAVGLLKSELYVAGGRPVLYGLTCQHTEISQEGWPRFLAEACGIGEAEQYRYVSMNLGAGKEIDWTHEREWRWADHGDKIDVPELPIWRRDPTIRFRRALVIVQTEEEAVAILTQLRRCLDAGSDILGNAYNLDLLKATYVVSLQRLEKTDLLQADSSLTIENIPHDLQQPIPTTVVSDEAKGRVRQVIKEALQAAAAAAAEWRKGGDRDACGFAELVIDDGLSEFTRAGLELNLLRPFSGIRPFGSGGYWVEGLFSVCEMQGLGEKEAAAEAAKRVINEHFPGLSMHIWTRWD